MGSQVSCLLKWPHIAVQSVLFIEVSSYVTVHAKRWDKSAKYFFELALDYENTTPWEPS